MTDPKLLLERHKPRLVYDSIEAYFADSAAIWTDFRFTRLNRADGAVAAPQPTLAFLGATKYADGKPASANDTIGETTRDYKQHASDAHANVRYRNRVHGRAKRDDQGRLWLQYWCFYYYNNFQLAGPLSAGNHEGDWEMIQLLLDANERPTQAVYSQHKAAEAKPWSAVRKAPSSAATPLVFVARGSHAAYFTPGQHWTGAWLDNADGKGPQIDPAVVVLGDNEPGWAVWPGRWGDTRAAGGPIDSDSPRGPGRVGESGVRRRPDRLRQPEGAGRPRPVAQPGDARRRRRPRRGRRQAGPAGGPRAAEHRGAARRRPRGARVPGTAGGRGPRRRRPSGGLRRARHDRHRAGRGRLRRGRGRAPRRRRV